MNKVKGIEKVPTHENELVLKMRLMAVQSELLSLYLETGQIDSELVFQKVVLDVVEFLKIEIKISQVIYILLVEQYHK